MNNDIKLTCQTCIYFLQHYIWYRCGYKAINYGHCKQGKRVKHMHASKKACESWQEQNADYINFYIPPKV